MTQKSNFLGKTNKNNGFTSNWTTRQNFTTTTNKIALCPERVNASLQVDSLLSIPPRRSSNPRTPFVLHSKLSTLLSGLAGHSFSCSLYCILTHPCELFRRKSIPANHFNFSERLYCHLLGHRSASQCLSLRQLRSCHILFPTLLKCYLDVPAG